MEKEVIFKSFKYDKVTGSIKRLDRRNSDGSLDKDGYLIIKHKGKQYKAHRLAWLFHTGEWPKEVIHHKNGIRTDNRIKNLESTSQAINCKKSHYKPNKDTGVVGVYVDRTNGLKKKYATKFNGKTFRFRSVEEALQFKHSHYGTLK